MVVVIRRMVISNGQGDETRGLNPSTKRPLELEI